MSNAKPQTPARKTFKADRKSPMWTPQIAALHAQIEESKRNAKES